MNAGRFIAFEGLDGCGKSTQLRRLSQALDGAGIAHVTTAEPTKGPIGQRIRAMAQSGERLDSVDELRWFMEDRAEHVVSVIVPALARGEWVLTDRYYLSTVAYQGARGLDATSILAESQKRFPAPDLALLFAISARAGLDRVEARGGTAEPVFEELEFLERVEQVFAALELPFVERLDADRPADEIALDVLRIVRERLGVPELA